MEYDEDKLDEVVLALMSLNIHNSNEYGARAWKGLPWEATDRLYEKGHISDPARKAKSVVLGPEDVRLADELFRKHFGIREEENARS